MGTAGPKHVYHGTSLTNFTEMLRDPHATDESLLYVHLGKGDAQIYSRPNTGGVQPGDRSPPVLLTLDLDKLDEIGDLQPDWVDGQAMLDEGQFGDEYIDFDDIADVSWEKSLEVVGACSYAGPVLGALVSVTIGNKTFHPPFKEFGKLIGNLRFDLFLPTRLPVMNWEKIIKTALERTSRDTGRGTIRLHDLSLARMPDIAGWRVDKPNARDEMLGGGVTEVTYSGRTERGHPLEVVLDKDRGQWIASAGGMELDAPASGDVLDPSHVQDVLSYAMRQMDEEIAKSQRRQKPKGRPQAPRIPMFAEGRTDSNIRNAATRMAENIMARDNELTDPGNKVGDWSGGWLNGEWKCPKCHTIIGRNLEGKIPHGLVGQHKCVGADL